MVLVVVSCKSTTQEDRAASETAKEYYEKLLNGDYEGFVDGKFTPERIPDSYRQQLVDNMKMFIAQQQQEHRGIKQVRIDRQTMDKAKRVASVFLVFSYGDNTTEQVLVPMIKYKDTWYMQ